MASGLAKVVSPSELEDCEPHSEGGRSGDAVPGATVQIEDRFCVLLGSRSRSGELSESESAVSVGGTGEPSLFFARNPALNRLLLILTAMLGTGRAGIGEESAESDEDGACAPGWIDESTGSMGSLDDTSGVESIL